jgi:uncharacterized protein (DUF1330 family)
MACERGASFGYNNLVSRHALARDHAGDRRPVVFDATHSVQLPGGQGTSSGGQREMVPVLSRAAVAVGIAGLFMETHPDPAKALSDGPNAVPLKHMKALLETLLALDRSPRRTLSSRTSFKLNETHMSQRLHHRQHRSHQPGAVRGIQEVVHRSHEGAWRRVCVRGGRVEVLEGDWAPHRVVMLKFPSFEQAKAFYESPEYGKARTSRPALRSCA